MCKNNCTSLKNIFYSVERRVSSRPRPKSLSMSLHSVQFEKGPGRKGLGFSVVRRQKTYKNIKIYIKYILFYAICNMNFLGWRH